MPSTPPGRNAATLIAVVLAIALALVWLRTSGGSAPAVPPGLSVRTLPAVAAEEAEDSAGLGWGGGGSGASDAGAGERPDAAPDRAAPERRRPATVGQPGPTESRQSRDRARLRRGGHAGRAGGAGEDDSASLLAERLTRRQDPPATAPAPSAGSGAGASAPQAPEFAFE